jgi:hypothetical protein
MQKISQKEVKENILYGEEEIRKLSNRFQLNEGDIIRGFREYLQLQGKDITKQLLQLKRTLEKMLYILTNVNGDFLR